MKNGFSLIETLILLAVSVAALIALVNVFFIFNSLYGYEQAFLKTAGSAGTAMNALQSSILQADAVLASSTFSGTTYTSTTTSIVLELPAIDASGNLILGAKDRVAFFASSTKLYRLTAAAGGSARVSGTTTLTSALQSISFTYSASDVAQSASTTVDLQTRLTYKQQVLSAHLREQWYLRNRP